MIQLENAYKLRVADAYRDAIERLAVAGVEQPALVSGWLLAWVTGENRLSLASSPRMLTEDQAGRWEHALQRAARHEPVQYITGYTDFRDLRILCDARALIPRPETEQGVGVVLSDLCWQSNPDPVCVDVGTGTGCVALALARALPHAQVWGLDVEEAALSLARENANHNALADRVAFCQSDLFQNWGRVQADLVFANLPYIEAPACARLPETVRYEPMSALNGGEDGLDFIRALVRQAPSVMRPGGLLFLEIGFQQGAAVRGMVEHAGFLSVQVVQDWSGKDRFVRGVKS